MDLFQTKLTRIVRGFVSLQLYVFFSLILRIIITKETTIQQYGKDICDAVIKLATTMVALYIEHAHSICRVLSFLVNRFYSGASALLLNTIEISGFNHICQLLDFMYVCVLVYLLRDQIFKGMDYLAQKWQLLRQFANVPVRVEPDQRDEILIRLLSDSETQEAAQKEFDSQDRAGIVDRYPAYPRAPQLPPIIDPDLLGLTFDDNGCTTISLFSPDLSPRSKNSLVVWNKSMPPIIDPDLLGLTLVDTGCTATNHFSPDLSPRSENSLVVWNKGMDRMSHTSFVEEWHSSGTSSKSSDEDVTEESAETLRDEWTVGAACSNLICPVFTVEEFLRDEWTVEVACPDIICPVATVEESMHVAAVMQYTLIDCEIMILAGQQAIPLPSCTVPIWTRVRNRYTLISRHAPNPIPRPALLQ